MLKGKHLTLLKPNNEELARILTKVAKQICSILFCNPVSRFTLILTKI